MYPVQQKEALFDRSLKYTPNIEKTFVNVNFPKSPVWKYWDEVHDFCWLVGVGGDSVRDAGGALPVFYGEEWYSVPESL